MEDIRAQQIEAIQVLGEYAVKLVKGIDNVTAELNGEKLADTEEYLKEIVKGINWSIEVVNGTMSLINEKEEIIDKQAVNKTMLDLSDALKTKDDAKTAEVLSSQVKPFVEKLIEISKAYA